MLSKGTTERQSPGFREQLSALRVRGANAASTISLSALRSIDRSIKRTPYAVSSSPVQPVFGNPAAA
jgi:hypothetical protein